MLKWVNKHGYYNTISEAEIKSGKYFIRVWIFVILGPQLVFIFLKPKSQLHTRLLYTIRDSHLI